MEWKYLAVSIFEKYNFIPEWQLVDRDGKPFQFDVHKDPVKNNQRYNQIGEVH